MSRKSQWEMNGLLISIIDRGCAAEKSQRPETRLRQCFTRRGGPIRSTLRRWANSTACARDAGGIKAQIGQQFAALAVFDEAVGHAQPSDVSRIQAGIGGGLQHRAAKTAGQRAFFHRQHKRTVLQRA